MTPIYLLATGVDDKYRYGGLLESSIKKNWFSQHVMTVADFEQAHHKLLVLDSKERDVPSERLHDIDEVHPAVFAFSEHAWPLLPALQSCGCRVADDVEVTGKVRFKLVYPGRVLDILDHERSEVIINEAAGAVSHVRNRTLHLIEGEPPLMFHVMLHGPEKSGPSIDVFVSQAFIDAYDELGLTGASFFPVKISPDSK